MFTFFRKPVPEPVMPWPNHRDWAGAQGYSPDAMVAYVQARLNPILHHCRIGKITLKANGSDLNNQAVRLI